MRPEGVSDKLISFGIIVELGNLNRKIEKMKEINLDGILKVNNFIYFCLFSHRFPTHQRWTTNPARA